MPVGITIGSMGSDINLVDLFTLVGVAFTSVGVSITVGKLLWDWAKPRWIYRRPFDVECLDSVIAYSDVYHWNEERAERYAFKLTFSRDVANQMVIPEFSTHKRLGHGEAPINISKVFEKGTDIEWTRAQSRVYHKGDLLELKAISRAFPDLS